MLARTIRRALPPRWQPPARFLYERMRGLLEREIPLVRRTVRPGERTIDVGANVGIYTYALWAAGASVEAFEPQARCADVLEAFAAGRRGVRVHRVALGPSAGSATLRIPTAGGRAMPGNASLIDAAHDAETQTVAVQPLDAFAFADTALIKIDVEGFELGVIDGAPETIARGRPLLLVEIERRHHQGPVHAVVARIAALGYAAFFLDERGRRRPFSEFDPDRHQSMDQRAGRSSAAYVNNFLFEPTDGSRRWRW